MRYKNPDFSKMPPEWTLESKDFCEKLLIKDPSKRLGARGISQVMAHPWIKDFDFKSLKAEKQRTPFEPGVRINYEVSIVDSPWKEAYSDLLKLLLNFIHFFSFLLILLMMATKVKTFQ